jgi:hypothetical protein
MQIFNNNKKAPVLPCSMAQQTMVSLAIGVGFLKVSKTDTLHRQRHGTIAVCFNVFLVSWSLFLLGFSLVWIL